MKVLVIDTDPQCNLTQWLLPKADWHLPMKSTIMAVYQDEHPVQPLMRSTNIPRVWLLPAHPDLPPTLPYDQERHLAEGLSRLNLEDPRIDVILIDTQPGLYSLTRSAVIAARYVIFPFRLDEPSDNGTQRLFSFLEGVEASQQLVPLDLLGGVANAYDETRLAESKLLELRDHALAHPRLKRSRLEPYSFWLATVNRRADFPQAEHNQCSVFELKGKSPAIAEIQSLTKGVLDRVNSYAYLPK